MITYITLIKRSIYRKDIIIQPKVFFNVRDTIVEIFDNDQRLHQSCMSYLGGQSCVQVR